MIRPSGWLVLLGHSQASKNAKILVRAASVMAARSPGGPSPQAAPARPVAAMSRQGTTPGSDTPTDTAPEHYRRPAGRGRSVALPR